MLPWPEVDDRIRDLVGEIYESPFANIGRFAAWVGISHDVVRQWTARNVPRTMLTRLVAEAASIPLSDWMLIGGERDRLHDDTTGALNPVWEVGLAEDVGINPARMKLWLDNETMDAEERLALLICITREALWKNRYRMTLADRNRRKRVHLPETHRSFLEDLRRKRLEMGYTQVAVAEIVGCSPAVLADWELGIRGYNWHSGKPTAAVATYAALLERLPQREVAVRAGV